MRWGQRTPAAGTLSLKDVWDSLILGALPFIARFFILPNHPARVILERTQLCLQQPPCFRPPRGFLFSTAKSPGSFTQHSRPPAVWPPAHFLPPAHRSCPLSVADCIPPPRAVRAPHPAFGCAMPPPWNVLSFLPSASQSNKLLLFSFQYQMVPSLGMPRFREPNGLTYRAGSGE